MKNKKLIIAASLLSGLLVLLPNVWAQTPPPETPEPEVLVTAPPVELSPAEQAADYTTEPETTWEEGVGAQGATQ